MDYRLYRSDDFARLYEIEEICFEPPHRFGRRYMRSLISHPASATWIAEESGVMAGFAIVHWSTDPHSCEHAGNSAYVQTLEVDPAFRRHGIARALLRRLETSASQAGASLIWLHVDAANAPAIALYSDAGYVRQGSADHYYGPGRPADILVRSLLPSDQEF
jgi:[ribosomal protein S18]-alanine N-acetyltransferase